MRAIAILTIATVAAACTMALEDRTDSAHGAMLFAENCAMCHGADARGPEAPGDWTGIPPDLTRLAARNDGAFPDLSVIDIVHGNRRRGDETAVMPIFGDSDLGPLVVTEIEEGVGTPVPADLIALTAYLRSLQE